MTDRRSSTEIYDTASEALRTNLSEALTKSLVNIMKRLSPRLLLQNSLSAEPVCMNICNVVVPIIKPPQRLGVAVEIDASRKVLFDCCGVRIRSCVAKTVALRVFAGSSAFRLKRKIVESRRAFSADFCVTSWSFSSSSFYSYSLIRMEPLQKPLFSQSHASSFQLQQARRC